MAGFQAGAEEWVLDLDHQSAAGGLTYPTAIVACVNN